MSLFSRLILISLLVVATSILCSSELRNKRDTPRKKCGDKVMNGEQAKKGEFPMMVSVNEAESEDRPQYCAGIIVHKDYILTSARCAYKNREEDKKKWKKMSESEVYIIAGDYDVGKVDQDEQKINVTKFIFGPDWNEKAKTGPDVMLWKLAESIKMKKKVAEVANLDDEKDGPKRGDKGYMAGWGLTLANPPKAPEKLMVGSSYTVENCNNKDKAKNVFCAANNGALGLGLIPTSVCKGDEGGPYLCGMREDKTRTVCGVASRNTNEKYCSASGIFTAVGPFTEWIEKTTSVA